LSDFGSKYVENEFKGASPSIHPRRKTKHTNHSNETNLKDDNLNIRQIMFAVLCAQLNTNVQLPNFSAKNVKLCCACTYVLEFTTVRCILETWGHYSMGKKPLQEMLSAVYFITIFCFISGMYNFFGKYYFH
jgi:hypothetical protein